MTFTSEISIVTIIHFAVALPLCAHILFTKRSESVAVGWIALVLLSPFVGATLYWLLGINRIARKARKLRGSEHPDLPELGSSTSNQHKELSIYERDIRRFAYAIHNAPFVAGNSVEKLVDGDAAYPAMLDAINKATDSIALSAYIFNLDNVGEQFVRALEDAQKRSVQVRVIVDDVGLWNSFRPVDRELRKRGIRAVRFMPGKLRYLPFLNLRNHRKILLVDGRVGFTGGMNICGSNMVRNKPKKPVQDIHFRVTGPVLDQLSQVLEEDWLFASQEEIALPKWQKNATPGGNGSVSARFIPDGPDDDFEKLQWAILGGLALAQKTVRIMTPYFLPNEKLSSALMVAALRGVNVEVIVPERSDHIYIGWAMLAKFEVLIEHGVKIYRSPPPFDHSKIFVVDDVWSLVGSANWDQRSLRLNFEANLECYDPALAADLTAYFSQKKASAKNVTLVELKTAPMLARFRNALVKLTAPYL